MPHPRALPRRGAEEDRKSGGLERAATVVIDFRQRSFHVFFGLVVGLLVEDLDAGGGGRVTLPGGGLLVVAAAGGALAAGVVVLAGGVAALVAGGGVVGLGGGF